MSLSYAFWAEQDAYMQKWLSLNFTVKKTDARKFLWGDLGASPPRLFGRGGERPIESAPEMCVFGWALGAVTWPDEETQRETLQVQAACSRGLIWRRYHDNQLLHVLCIVD